MGLSVSQGHFGGLLREHGLIRGWAYPRDSTVPKNSAYRPMGFSDSKGASDECLCGHELVRQSRCTATSTQRILLVLVLVLVYSTLTALPLPLQHIY